MTHVLRNPSSTLKSLSFGVQVITRPDKANKKQGPGKIFLPAGTPVFKIAADCARVEHRHALLTPD
jgi:hypothetical protein